MITPEENAFAEFLKKKADKLEDDAGHSGSHSDGGARHLRNLVDTWLAGLAGVQAPIFDQYMKEYIRHTDPDYQKYLELKSKFE